jgi:2'-hydroxyisoflavone reductase
MTIDRRTFLKGSLAGGALLAAGCASSSTTGSAPSKPAAPPAKKSILILGGTGFLGPALVEAARPRGHTLTLFNRGKTNPGLFPDIEKLQGNRDGDLKALEGRKWDAVIDTSGYVPRVVKASADLLAPSVGHYVFISTISVYGQKHTAGMDESAPLEKLPAGEEKSEEVPKHYGALKALSEQAAEAAMPGRTTNIRPGLIVGPGDPTDRFTYWPVRLDRGGEAIAPGDGNDPVQLIDVRDLADWTIGLVEQKHTGVFNALGPERRLTMREMVEACASASAAPAKVVWVPIALLEKHEVMPWRDMPGWIPSDAEATYGQMSNRAAVGVGLKFRPVADTARDTLAWYKTLPEERRSKPMRAGVSPEKEKEVLAAFKASAAR